MSKTIVVMDAPDSVSSIDQLSDENPYFLGAFGEVIGALKRIFPEGNYEEPTEIKIKRNGDIKVEIIKHTPVQNFMMHLENEEDVSAVISLCKATNWRALDTDTGMFIDQGRQKRIDANQNETQNSWWQFWKK